MNSVVFAVVRLCTAVGVPRRAMLRARLAPITARPVTPITLLPLDAVIALPLGAGRPARGARRGHVTDPAPTAHGSGPTPAGDRERARTGALCTNRSTETNAVRRPGAAEH